MNNSILPSTKVNLESLAEERTIEERQFMFEVDRVKAFKKLASKQFKDPTLALRELVSNALDSYAGTNKLQTIDIVLDDEHFEVIDHGMGFTEDKIECLRTLGQSDKRGERGYIGRFGVGFASIFHPDLNVKRVLVDTKVNGGYERLEFTVQETGVSLKRYDLAGTPSFSTRIRADFEGLDWEKRRDMEKTLRDEAKYMNADIRLNGEDISGKAVFEQTRKYMLDLEGKVTGRICFFNRKDENEKHTESKVALLSHNVYVGSEECSFIKKGKKDFNLPRYFGFINGDDLNVITSRNDFRRDEKYKAFIGEVRKRVRNRFRRLCKEIGKIRDAELRAILMQGFDNYSNQKTFFTEYDPSKVKDACAKALAEAPVFTALNQTGAFSLNQIHEIGKRQGHVLCAYDDSTIELLEMQGYNAPIIRIEGDTLSFKGLDTFRLDNLYGYSGQIDEGFYNKLVEKGIINPKKLERKIELVSPDTMNENEQRFLTGLRKILGSQRVKQTLAQAGLDIDYTINIADISPQGIAACYNTRNIFINRKNHLSAQYIMEKDGNTATFYLPILAHELSHNILGRHDNPFYAMSDELSSKLALAVAEDIVEEKK